MDSSFQQQEFYSKLKSAFQEKTDRYRTVLHIQQTQVLSEAKSLIWDMQKELNAKLVELEQQVEMRLTDLTHQSQEQLELIVQVEEIIEQRKLMSEVPANQLQQVAAIIDEGVDANLQRWDEWKQKNIIRFIDELNQARLLYRPFLHHQLGNYVGTEGDNGTVKLLLKEEEFKQGNDESILGKFKHMLSGVVRQASSFSGRNSRKGSIAEAQVEPSEHVHTIKGHLQSVFACVQLSDESIVTSSFDGTIKVWGDDYNLVFSSSTLTTSYNDVVEITAHKLASETLMIAAANDDGSIKVFVKFAGQPWGFYKELPRVKEGSPFHLDYDAKQNVLLYNTQRNGRTIQIFDMSTFKLSTEIRQFSHKFSQSSSGSCLTLLSSEQRFLTADIAGYLYKWSYTSKQPLVKFKAHENCINAVTLLKDFRIATCCQDGLLKLWSGSMLGNKPLQVFEHKYPLWSLCATKRYLLSGDVEGFISYHCPDTLVIKKTIKAHSSGIFMLRECQMAIDKGYMSCGEDFKAKLWSV